MAFTKIDISSGTIFRIILIILGFWFLYVIRDVLLMLFAATVIAAVMEPVADRLQTYGLPRGISVLLIYALILALVVVIVTLMIPPLAEQVRQLAHVLPQVVHYIEQWQFLTVVQGGALVTSLQDILLQFGDRLTNASFDVFQRTRTFFSGLVAVLFIFVLAFYMVVENDALKKVFRLIVPQQHTAYIEARIERASRIIGRWVMGQIVLAFIIGVVVSLGLWLIGIPYALVLGLLAGVLEIIPVIGPMVAAIPGIVVGLSQSLFYGLGALLFYVIVQQVENHVLVPNVMRRATGLNPLVTIIAVLLGARLAGVAGIMLSVPMAIILSIFWSDMLTTSTARAVPVSDTPQSPPTTLQ